MRRVTRASLLSLCLLVAGLALLRPDGPTVTAANAASITAGGGQTCALTNTGGLLCWGANENGELGDGTTVSRGTPGYVLGLTMGVANVAPGLEHTCALLDGGSAQCWGQGGDGQLGDGLGQTSATPADVAGLTDGASIESGYWHTCAVTGTGGVKCWGLNFFGQLGDGSIESRAAPVDVLDEIGDPLTGIAAVSGGTMHTCALTEAQTVKCWGWNAYGQLGAETTELCRIDLGENEPCTTSPVDVVDGTGSPITGAVAVAAGINYSCALLNTGDILCWGSNDVGQLGDGTTDSSTVPVTVAGLGDSAASISIFGATTCALTTAGAAKCWGANPSGQLGNGTATFDPNPVPATVLGLGSGVAVLSAGGEHTCALLAPADAKCWGDNFYGQLGDGTTTSSPLPVGVVFSASGDFDSDGCTDLQEQSPDPAEGGARNSKDFWDFFDTPDGANVRDRFVSIGDIGRVVARFGTAGDPNIDPLSPPSPSGYHTAFDRSPPAPGADLWDAGPADGSIGIGDIAAAVAQFGHSCR